MEFEYGKRWFVRANAIDRQIWELEDEIKAYESCLECAGMSYDKINVVKSPENHFERVMCDIADCFSKIQELNLKKMEVLREINSALNQLEDCPERYVLRAFYVNHKSMKDIADKIGYEEHYCYELRKKGIERL